MAHRQHRQREASSRTAQYLRRVSPDDGQEGAFSRRRLQAMDERFRRAVERSFRDDEQAPLPQVREWLK